jgi:hypothetical protein
MNVIDLKDTLKEPLKEQQRELKSIIVVEDQSFKDITFTFSIRGKNDLFSVYLKLFLLMIGTISIIVLSIISMIGLGYLTDSTFIEKSIKSYDNWQILFMKFSIVTQWLLIIIFLNNKICKKSKNHN